MRISYLASAALAVSFLPLASPAFAGSAAYSGSDAQSITYGSGTYGSTGHTSHTSHSSGMHSTGSHSSQSMSTRYGSANTAACPSGTNRSSDGYCMTSGSSSSIGISGGSTFASSVYTSPPSMQSVSTEYTSPPSMRSVSTEYTSPPSMRYVGENFNASTSTIVPFRTSVNNISKHRIDGMGSNEFLSETSCPTSVYNPGGAQVLGCYSVVKAAPAPVYRPAPIYRPAPVVVPQIHYQQVRVVRPIIYVRYPVPTPVRVYQQNFSNSYQSYSRQYSSGGCGTAYSRYGNNWPRMGGGCGGW
ncbi:MAG: hypothetical protein L3J05_02940 [Robiginitomaculum sp.]|nr:hypothetical protein [Robiginitomaculum sp.]